VGSGERQRMMAKPVLCDTCQGLRCRCCGVLQDWSDSWSPVALVLNSLTGAPFTGRQATCEARWTKHLEADTHGSNLNEAIT
jgi:hypothetical protein